MFVSALATEKRFSKRLARKTTDEKPPRKMAVHRPECTFQSNLFTPTPGSWSRSRNPIEAARPWHPLVEKTNAVKRLFAISFRNAERFSFSTAYSTRLWSGTVPAQYPSSRRLGGRNKRRKVSFRSVTRKACVRHFGQFLKNVQWQAVKLERITKLRGRETSACGFKATITLSLPKTSYNGPHTLSFPDSLS